MRLFARVPLLLFLVNLLNYIDRQILFAVFPAIQHELQLSDTQLGLLASAFMWVYLATAPAFGLLGDRGMRPLLMGIGVGLWSLCTAASGLVRSYAQLLLGRAAVGIGEASYGSIAPAVLSDSCPPQHRGRLLAFFSMAIPVGSALGYLAGGAFERAFGWRAAFLLVGLPGVVLAWLVGRLPDDRGAAGAALPARPQRNAYGELLRTRSYRLNCGAMTAMTFAVGGLAAWVPTYLIRVRGMGLAEANLAFGLLTLMTGIGGTVVGGWLGDRLLPRIPAAHFLVSGVGLALSVPCAAAVMLVPHTGLTLAAIGLAEFFVFLNTGPLNAVIAAVSRPAVRATAFALNIFVIHALGDAVSPTLVGILSDRWGLSAAFWVAPGALLLAAVFCFRGMRTLAADVERLGGAA
jgi:MFS transporter, Spinster family, sphingosine-1-phosphate transporter